MLKIFEKENFKIVKIETIKKKQYLKFKSYN